MLLFWSAVFIASLFFLVKSADFLIESAKVIGRYFKMPSFIIGVLVVGIGTSLPELSSSIFAVLQNVPELVVANAIGSNIANILLIVGISSIIAKNIKVSSNLINLDIPLLLLSTALFALLAFDGVISRADSAFLLAGLLYYLTYSLASKGVEDVERKETNKNKPYKSFAIFAISLVFLIFSSKYLVKSVTEIASILNISSSVIALLAVAVGTSLPELFVSISAIKKNEADMALGNIFGSNAFNLLAVAGIPAVFASLPLDGASVSVALPVLVVSTILFAFSGISRKIHSFEGVFFLIIYVFFALKVLSVI